MLAILPAGGSAQRFGGIFKELLPIGEEEYLLSAAVRRSASLGATRSMVISNADKASSHSRFLDRHCGDLDITLTVRRERDSDLWQALRAVLSLCEQRNLLVLPDTVFQVRERIPTGCDLAFGVFLTAEPHRFSVLWNGGIRTKLPAPVSLHPAQTHWCAWGCVYWSRQVADFWLRGDYTHYDRAFEAALREFGYRVFAIDSYSDLGDYAYYREYTRR